MNFFNLHDRQFEIFLLGGTFARLDIVKSNFWVLKKIRFLNRDLIRPQKYAK